MPLALQLRWEPWPKVSWSPAASWECHLQAPGVAKRKRDPQARGGSREEEMREERNVHVPGDA